MEKAIREFARRGYHATTVADILEGLGIARGTFYQYFANKKAIFDEVVNNLLEKVTKELKPPAADQPKMTPYEMIRSTIIRVLNLLLEDRDMARVLLSGTTGIDSEFDQRIKSFYSQIHGGLTASLELGSRLGYIRNINNKFFACCIIGSVKEILAHGLDDPDDCPDTATITDFILDYNLYGVFTKTLSV